MTLNFTDQDLRNRSFRKQILNGADFTGADLRGCDFRGAQLMNACFEGVKTGQTNRQKAIWISTIVLTFIIMGHAISHLVFGSLGQTPADKAWNYVIALVFSLAIAGACSSLSTFIRSSRCKRIAIVLSGVTSGALAGFFYAGVAAGKSPQWAIAGAISGSLLSGIVTTAWQRTTSTVIVTMSGAIAAYGFAFLTGTLSLSLFNLAHLKQEYLVPGLLVGGLSLFYLGLTLNAVSTTIKKIQQAPGTSFRRANLTNAHFNNTRFTQTDFTHATGWPEP